MASRRDSVNLFHSTKVQIVVGFLLVALIVAARLAPHAPNFTPVAAVGLFAGVYFSKGWAPLLPLAGLLISDLFIGGYGVRGMVVVYGAFGLTFLLGKLIKRGGLFNRTGRFGAKSFRLFGGAMSAAALFFLITNNVFLYTPALYTHDFTGMTASYIAGLPFLRWQILGDLVYSSILFGAYELARAWSGRKFCQRQFDAL
jgi:hypothetical protein